MSLIFHDPILIRGTISNLQCSQDSRDVLSGRSDSTFVGATAVATGAAGFGGQAVGLASLMDTDLSETMDYVRFELDGKELVGNLWRFPFEEGDEVEAVVEEYLGKYKVYSVKRLHDNLVTVYPHSSCGMIRHLFKAIKLWLCLTTIGFIPGFVMMYFVGLFDSKSAISMVIVGIMGGYIILLIISFLVSCKFIKFVRIAEKIFKTYGWPNPSRIDLYKTSKKYRRDEDPEQYGTRVFRFSNE